MTRRPRGSWGTQPTLTSIRRLIAKGESETLELKRSTGELREGMEALCAFLNNRGGTVVFGAAPDGRIIGQTVAENTLHDVTAASRNIEPAPQVNISKIAVGGGRDILVLQAGAGTQQPYTFDGRGFLRVGNTTRRMKREEYERLLLSRLHARHRWENLPATGWTVADLDAEEIERTVVEAVAAKRLAAVPSEKPKAILERLHLLGDGTLTQAAVVLFAKDPMPDYPQCAIRLARFRGVTKSEFIDNRQYQGHAFALLRHAEAFFDMHLPVASRVISGQMRREDRPQYPPEALREAVVNALCHRDYSEAGASIGVAIFDDRLEIWSYGRLPGELTPEKLRVDHPSVLRNDLIADVFYRRGYIEKWGRGTQKILDLCRRAGLRDPEFVERTGEVGVRFWPAAPVTTKIVEEELSPRQREIISVLASRGEVGIEDIRRGITAPPTARMVQRLLAGLVEAGRVVRIGKGRSTRYRLAG
ncbi:MAG: putative DNA binding domain-containing protein [Myxococcales bacterium]|nr:putative DNA binding domain-containing protein [Myxococcales bacterium]